jgi:uncharacterized membrane protein
VLALLRTREELSFIVNCTGDKYAYGFLGLRVFEGGEALLKRQDKCSLVLKLIKCLNNILPSSLQSWDIIKVC